MTICSIGVYCGSQSGKNPVFGDAARLLGADMAKNGLRLVYGGGAKGLMGEVARGVIDNGGEVTGIIPDFLMAKEQGQHPLELSELIITEDMPERKQAMYERADAFVALPGGIGTLEEIVEVITLAQLGRHKKPMVFANFDGFWNPMLDLVKHMDKQGFIHTKGNLNLLIVDKAEEIVSRIISAV